MTNGKLSIFSGAFVVLAFVLRALIPDNQFLPWGSSHYVRSSWLVFQLFLLIGTGSGLVVALKIVVATIHSMKP